MSPKVNEIWYSKSVVAHRTAQRALLESLEPIRWLSRCFDTRFLPVCDNPALETPFLAFDALKVLRLVRQPALSTPPAPSMEVTRVGMTQLLGIYTLTVSGRNDKASFVYENKSGYKILRLVCQAVVAWCVSWAT